MQKIIIVVAAILFSGSLNVGVAQDEPSDAEYIVEQLITPELFESAMAVMAGIVAQSIELEFKKQGQEVSAPTLQWLGEEMSSQMGLIMAQKVSADYVRAYEKTLSEDALSGLRIFLESPAGQEFAVKQSILTREGAAIGEKYGEEIAGEAVGVIVANIQAGRLSDNVTSVVKDELVELFGE